MANSFKRYTGDGSTTDFSVTFPYLDKAHVGVKVDGSSASFTWFNDTTVRMDTAPANGSVVEVRRTTPVQRIVDFQDGAVIIEENLDDSAQQALYLSEEASDDSLDALRDDGANVWDGQSKRIKDIADPTSAQDVATRNFAETGMSSQLVRAEAEADDAATSATNAATSETNAASSASAASTSESNAATSASNAATSETNASTHASNASSSATAASNSETNASNSASAASTSETNAANSESAAATSETNAAFSESAAATSESNAATSEANASSSATESSNWAQYAEDSPVPEGNGSEYSAYHWAKKAEGNTSTTAANVSYDNSGSSLTATDVKAALNELDNDVTTHGHTLSDISDSGGLASGDNAGDVPYSNGTSGLSATDVQAAIDEVAGGGSGGGPTVVQKTADEEVQASTTLQDDDHLVFTCEANKAYEFELTLLCLVSSATVGFRFGWSVPSGADLKWQDINNWSADSNLLAAANVLTSDGSSNPSGIVLKGVIRNGSTAGDLQLRWAQKISQLEWSRLLKNSSMVVRELGAS